MHRKIIITTITIMLFATLVGGATMAFFTDVASNVNNRFSAGTVEIVAIRAMGEPIPGPMFYTTEAEGRLPGQSGRIYPTGLWWPGRTVIRNLAVMNTGSLEVRLHKVSAQIESINGEIPTDAPVLSASFARNMNVKIFVAGHPVDRVLYNGSLATLLNSRTTVHQPVIAPFTGLWPPVLQLVYEVTMSSTAGNDLQGIRPIVSFSVYAEQTANNP